MKAVNKKENIYSFKGISKVFKFTAIQTFKNKTYLISMIMFIFMLTIMSPLMIIMSNQGEKTVKGIKENAVDELKVKSITVVDKAGTGLSREDVVMALPEYNDADINLSDDENAKIAKDSVILVISSDTEEGMRNENYNVILSDDSVVSSAEAEAIAEEVMKSVSSKRIAEAGVDDSVSVALQNGVSTGKVYYEEDFEAKDSGAISAASLSSYILQFSILVFFVATFSASYIIASVNEEKTSKLVETLLVSVRPMALIFGKILGTLTYIMVTLILGIIGNMISTKVMGMMGYNTDSMEEAFKFGALTRFGAGYTILIVVSIVIAILFFGILSGIMGSTCVRPEDQQSASSSVIFIGMIGYMLSVMLPGMIQNKEILYNVMAIVPPVSFFSNAVLLATGKVSWIVGMISYGIEILLLVLVFLICAKTYRKLIINDSKKAKIIDVIKMARE
ncbi:MAG: ABC transporter permease [Eubacterium sp.]|nr:ABC transporter permease [Eubacterium sp.]